MKDIGMMHYFLNIEVWNFLDEIFLNQGKFYVQNLKRFGMMDFKVVNNIMVTNLKLLNDDSSDIVDVTLYRHITGSLMYLLNMRPYICFVINTLIQYMVDPRHVNLVAAKHVMRYLNGSLNCGIIYAVDGEIRLHGYSDSDWVGITYDRKRNS